MDLDGNSKRPSRIEQAMNNGLCIDLARYIGDEFGSSTGASSSMIVQVVFAVGNSSPEASSGGAATQYRTLPFQNTDWNPTALQNLQVFTFLECGYRGLLQRGVYIPA